MTRACPICGGEAKGRAFPFSTDWNGKCFAYLACDPCNATFVDPVPDAADFAVMYSKANYHDEHYSVVAIERYRQSIRLLKGLVGDQIRLLDFGCGNGSFIGAGRLEGVDCAGVEIDPETIAFAKANSGCPVMTLEEMKVSGRMFDVIHLGDVLEHLPQPSDLLKDIEYLLAPGGRFFIEGPLENNASLVYSSARLFATIGRLLGRAQRGSRTPTHLFRVDSVNQRAFFTDRMGYKELYFSIHETGWPYYIIGKPFRLSPRFLLKSAIGRAAIALGGRATPWGGTFGNRFAALYLARD